MLKTNEYDHARNKTLGLQLVAQQRRIAVLEAWKFRSGGEEAVIPAVPDESVPPPVSPSLE